jgi:hypothetical protein
MLAMSKRRLIRWSLILVILAAFAVWLEPTRVVWGWLRGEAFYQGRPTSWWAGQLDGWEHTEFFWSQDRRWGGDGKTWWRFRYEPSYVARWLHESGGMPEPAFPAILRDYPKARLVLKELADCPNEKVAEIARERLSGRGMYGPNYFPGKSVLHP